MDRNAFRILEFCRRNSISRSKAYDDIRAGKLKAKKSGKVTLITAEAEREYLDAMPTLELGASEGLLEELAAAPTEEDHHVLDIARRFVVAIAKMPVRKRDQLVERFNDLCAERTPNK